MITSTASTTTSTSLATTGHRDRVLITNTDANRLYVLLGEGTASSSNHSFFLDTGDVFELVDYGGPISGVWAADGSGSSIVTEL